MKAMEDIHMTNMEPENGEGGYSASFLASSRCFFFGTASLISIAIC